MKHYSIVFATHNTNKVSEISAIVPDFIHLKSLSEIAWTEEIPENELTIRGNAISKAQYVYDRNPVDVFAEDTGLIVDALDGAPGVYSARYAGSQRDSNDNMSLLLRNLEGKNNRNARFYTCIALILNGNLHTFEGEVEGQILENLAGQSGFGYDPIFRPMGFDCSFAEMSLEEKGKISHRAIAFSKMVEFLEKLEN